MLKLIDEFNATYEQIEVSVDYRDSWGEAYESKRTIVEDQTIPFPESGIVKTLAPGSIPTVIVQTALGNVVVSLCESSSNGSFLVCAGPEVLLKTQLLPVGFVLDLSSLRFILGSNVPGRPATPNIGKSIGLLQEALREAC